MAGYSAAVRTLGAGAGTPTLEVRTTSADQPRILEIGLTTAAVPVTSTFAVGRPQAIGITPSSTTTLQAEDPANLASTIIIATVWGTAPTVPNNFFRRFNTQVAQGPGVMWTWPRGLLINPSSSLVLWNVAANVAADAWVVADE